MKPLLISEYYRENETVDEKALFAEVWKSGTCSYYVNYFVGNRLLNKTAFANIDEAENSAENFVKKPPGPTQLLNE